MDRNQQYVISLLDRIPASEFSDPAHQDAFTRIKDTLGQAQDLRTPLRVLYKVTNFSDVALGLMWIADKVERDPSKLESTGEEESLVAGLLKNAFGESTAVPTEAFSPVATEDPFGIAGAQESEPAQPGAIEQMPAPEVPTEEAAAPEPSPVGTVSGVPAAGGGGNENDFAVTLEKLVEAIQSGSEERAPLLEELTAQAEQVVARPDSGDDFKAFCGYMVEFLKYVAANQLFDDIRVMNMMTNAFDPFSQWVSADAGARTGMLDQPNEVLRDFKSLFE